MKKLAIVVSLILACVLSVVGIKSVSAFEVMPSYCVLSDTDHGFSDQDYIFGLLEQKVQGDMMNPKTTVDATIDVVGDGHEVGDLDEKDFKNIGAYLGVDYVLVLRSKLDTSYDENIHRVECTLDIIDTINGLKASRMASILDAKSFSAEDETRNALEQFIHDMDAVNLN